MPEVAHWCQSCARQEMRGWRRNKLLPGISLHLMPRAKRTKTCSRSQCKAHCALYTRVLSTVVMWRAPASWLHPGPGPRAQQRARSDIHSHCADHFANCDAFFKSCSPFSLSRLSRIVLTAVMAWCISVSSWGELGLEISSSSSSRRLSSVSPLSRRPERPRPGPASWLTGFLGARGPRPGSQ